MDLSWLQERLKSGPKKLGMNHNIFRQSEQQIQCVGEVCINQDNSISLGCSHPTFAVRSERDGIPAAYSHFMALANITAEDLTI